MKIKILLFIMLYTALSSNAFSVVKFYEGKIDKIVLYPTPNSLSFIGHVTLTGVSDPQNCGEISGGGTVFYFNNTVESLRFLTFAMAAKLNGSVIGIETQDIVSRTFCWIDQLTIK